MGRLEGRLRRLLAQDGVDLLKTTHLLDNGEMARLMQHGGFCRKRDRLVVLVRPGLPAREAALHILSVAASVSIRAWFILALLSARDGHVRPALRRMHSGG
jgi:hypothetical protein